MGAGRIRHAGTAAVVAAWIAALYANALDAPFVFDDFPNIVKNPYVTSFEPSLDGVRRVVVGSPSPRPLANLSFAVLHHFHGLDVRGYHLVNVAIHLANALLVYAIALQWMRRSSTIPGQALPLGEGFIQPAAAIAAIVFAAHPIQVQSVTYVVQRMTGLSTLFYLATLWLYVAGRYETAAGARLRRFGLACVCGLLSLASKQIAVTLPAALWLLEWFLFRDLSRRWLRAQLPWIGAAFVLAGALLAANVGVLNLSGYAERPFSLEERLWTQLRVVVWYASLLVWPDPGRLNLAHDFPISRSLFDPPSTMLCAIAIAATLVAAGWHARRWRLPALAVFWYFLHLALESSVLPLELVFEHRLYLPSVAPIIACAALGTGWISQPGRLSRRARQRWALGVLALLLASLSVATRIRNETWSNPLRLWTDVVEKSPGDARAHFNLGVALGDLGRFDEAIVHHEASLRVDPDDAKAHNGLGVALAGQHRYLEAIRHFAAAVRLNPDDPEARGNLRLAVERLQAGGPAKLP